MLESLKITNFALIEDASLEMGRGFNVITGETGAGKSILVGALSMVLGEWVGQEIVRSGSGMCEVEAAFSNDLGIEIKEFLKEKELSESELILRRKFYSKGMSKCYINDHHITLSTLRELGNLLVDIHSQNQHQTLLKKKNQMKILDKFSESENILNEIQNLWNKFNKLKDEKVHKINAKKHTEKEIERLKFEISEIDSACLHDGIDDEVEKDYSILSNIGILNCGVEELYGMLYENDESVIEKLADSVKKLEELGIIDGKFKDIRDLIERGICEIESASESLRSYRDETDFDSSRLEEVLNLRNDIMNLKRKYGNDISTILEYRSFLEKKILEYENFDDIIKDLEIEIRNVNESLNSHASVVTEKRKKASLKLAKIVEKKLKTLGMEGAGFKVKLIPAELGPKGAEKVEFVISPNPGQPEMELSKIASGGEISRIMLAIKSALADCDNIPILVFDEIDTGIGATIAKPVGKEIKNLSKYHQIIVITHLPQIADFADVHIKVQKCVSDKITRTVIEKLGGENREKEITRMFSG